MNEVVSHSSDLVQLKFYLRVTNLSQRSPTRRPLPSPGCVCELPTYAVGSAASPPPAPGYRLTVSAGQPWGLGCRPGRSALILSALRGDTLYPPLSALNGACELSLEKRQLSQMRLRTRNRCKRHQAEFSVDLQCPERFMTPFNPLLTSVELSLFYSEETSLAVIRKITRATGPAPGSANPRIFLCPLSLKLI